MHPAPWDPVGGPATAHIVNRAILDGFAVVQEYQQHRNGVPTLSGHGVYWYDESKQQYVLTWWDSMGGTGSEFRGGFDGDVLDVQSPMPQGGYCRATFDLSTPGAYAFEMMISNDGQTWQPSMDGRYRRASTPAKKAASPRRAKVVRKAASARVAKKTSGRKRTAARTPAKAARRRGRR